ncbi:hypothetical protein PTSG_04552 [Salpingoeca rosetta]|uniref:Ribosome production factor 2 homolog n=1 Tax=Salpingoeca rosetta (strain ATCC 50818 / BSB-021) TaxID=946362 RepID=F2U7R8_SALR5|nr:uncharacterized protein PTSG_04552 [Salpingoeca rosetta]EGD72823.1 hypothetical protein PTSG_04552 [Salpingoeca rosetta]|eukprot:XP_004994646.1 hypothetical protein PTSG_04552 [Salpingoeca rosetta]
MNGAGGGAKTARGRRVLKEREPKVHEDPKSIIYLHGTKCSQVVKEVFKDMHDLTRGQSRIYSRKHDLRPMDDHTYLEGLSRKQDASLFLVGTSNKKRPNCITFARMFNHNLLDMAEVQVLNFKPSHKFKNAEKPAAMSKPAIIFEGHSWDHEADFKQLKSILADVFRGPVVSRVNLAGLDRAIVFSADEARFSMHQYRVKLKTGASQLPLVELDECGPAVDFKMGRLVHPSQELMKQAMWQPKQLIKKAPKNIEYSALGEKLGRVHMHKQDMGSLQLRKVKALKRSAKERAEAKKNKPVDPTAGGRKKPKQTAKAKNAKRAKRAPK